MDEPLSHSATTPATAGPGDASIGDAPALRFDRSELDGSIIARFEKVARRFADRVAMTGNTERWTYQALDGRANQIAHAIIGHTTPGTGCIAYLCDHSPAMVICALAALKAAKAYLCIHPGLPTAAQRDVIADAEPDLLLCDAAHATAAREIAGPDCPVLCLDEIDERYPAQSPGATIEARDPAVIFYTSGTTGQPKGVVKSHRAVLHRAWLCAQYDFLTPADRHSLVTSCSFASSESDVFGALLYGASVCLFDVRTQGLADFGGWIDRQQITVLHPPVVLFRRYLSTLEGVNLHPTVRLVALAGETVVASDIEQWRQKFAPSCALRHRFSSTEAGHVAVACIEPGDIVTPGIVPAARPVTDKYLSVVDDEGRPVKEGETGELVVRSTFLSDGYWRRESQSAGIFTADSDHPEHRIFRTGDLGRITSDGGFEFLGRRDNQVKIRGYRVETREIEHALLNLSGVREAAVIDERRNDQTRLIGFVAMNTGASFHHEAMRAEMRAFLPEWKIPSQILSIDTLPLTLTGKVDRQLLRKHLESIAPSDPSQKLTPAASPDADDTTAQITAMWEELLGKSALGPDDNFFDLGGHSLLAVQLMYQIKQRFGRSLPVTVLSEAPTVRQLAESLRQAADVAHRPSGKSPIVVELKKGSPRPPLFCVPVARGTALTYLPLARLLSDEQPVHALQFPDGQGPAVALDNVEQMAAHFIEHVRRQAPHGPYRFCGHSFGAVLAYEMARQLHESGQRVDLLAMFDGRVPGSRRLLPLHRRLLVHLRRMRPLSPLTAYAYVIERIRGNARQPSESSRCDPPDLDDAGFASNRATYEARVRAFRAYRPRPYDGIITLFRPTLPPDWAEFNVPLPFNGWDPFCRQIELVAVPGDHLSMLHEPNLSVLASQLDACLAQVDRNGSSLEL